MFAHHELPEASVQVAHLVIEPAVKQTLLGFRTDAWQMKERSHDLRELNSGRHRLVLDVLRQLSGAVAYLHCEGVMHRDIKPDNVGVYGVTEPFTFFLLDLGHAIEASSSSDHWKGTLRYLAPEVHRLKRGTEKAPYGPGVDVWSLGLMAAELLHQITVRDADQASQLADDIRKTDEQLPMYRALRGMLQHEPTHRWSMAKVVNVLDSNDKIETIC